MSTLTLLLHFLTPSFLRHSSSAPGAKRKLYPTSYLDGLRGIAAFIVFIDHFGTNWFEPLRRGYGSTEENHYLIQLPFIRLLYAGRASVAVFFVISGFVLSYKPLKQIRAAQFEALQDTLASSVFRRGLRLYLPVAAGTFISMLMAWAGWYRALPLHSTDGLPPALPSLTEHFWHWKNHMVGIAWPFQDVMPNSPTQVPYNGHLWTIAIEYYGSMIVYVVVLGFSRCKAWVRMLGVGGTACAAMHFERWDIFLFLSGVMLAELSLMKVNVAERFEFEYASEKGSWWSQFWDDSALERWSRLLPTMNYFLCVFALYLLSYAGGSWIEYEPGPGPFHEYLMSWTPQRYWSLWFGFERFWTTIGGVILVFTISRSSVLQSPFTTPLAQYLGDISYALYIVHGPILFTAGTWFYDTYGQVEGIWQWGAAFAGAALFNTILCVWAGDLFWRGIDVKSVEFAKWFAGKCWVKH
ncbi:hypothetical protein G7Y89_g5231 [Cudoniella acicularis]|uniref:Acyltransferase 3 domain-containing protein n=1 Tax=Cudoniella acicularis TaxID=354080 RepID=A0A8H4W6P1_9HELO|nr:hypothetical protein G7Y89_g5231 [Cudoniella acicularis]